MSGRTERIGATGTATLDALAGAPVRALAGAAALVAVGGHLAVRVALNAPVGLPGIVAEARPALDAAALAVPALAAVALAVGTDRPRERVGLLFAGTFAVLAAVSGAATLPAAGALVGGGALVALARPDRLSNRPGPAVVAGGLLLGLAVSLSAALGLAPATLRPAGSTLSMLALAATPTLLPPGRAGWPLGGAVAAATLGAGSAAPYVTGAVALVAFGVVGAPLVAVAAGLGGGVAAAVGGVRSRRPIPALGVGLLVAAGVPATVPRALALVVGLALALDAVGGEPA